VILQTYQTVCLTPASFPPKLYSMTNSKYTLDRELHADLVGLVEDSVAQFCQDNMISGELAWLVTQCLATAKVEQFKGYVK